MPKIFRRSCSHLAMLLKKCMTLKRFWKFDLTGWEMDPSSEEKIVSLLKLKWIRQCILYGGNLRRSFFSSYQKKCFGVCKHHFCHRWIHHYICIQFKTLISRLLDRRSNVELSFALKSSSCVHAFVQASQRSLPNTNTKMDASIGWGRNHFKSSSICWCQQDCVCSSHLTKLLKVTWARNSR